MLARDVSLTLHRQEGTGILNLVPGEVRELAEEVDPALMLARIRIGETDLVARLTRRSAAALALTPGRAAWAQVKSVALVGWGRRGDWYRDLGATPSPRARRPSRPFPPATAALCCATGSNIDIDQMIAISSERLLTQISEST